MRVREVCFVCSPTFHEYVLAYIGQKISIRLGKIGLIAKERVVSNRFCGTTCGPNFDNILQFLRKSYFFQFALIRSVGNALPPFLTEEYHSPTTRLICS